MAKTLKRVGVVLGAAALVLMIPGVAPVLGSALGLSSGTMATIGTIAGVASPLPPPVAAAFKRADVKPPSLASTLEAERLAPQGSDYLPTEDIGFVQFAHYEAPETGPIPKQIEGGST